MMTNIITIFYLLLQYVPQTLIMFKKWNNIWKGICGGNGTPQPNEIIKIPAYLGINIEISSVLIFHNDSNWEMLIFLGTILGIASLPQLKTPFKKSVTSESEKSSL